MINENINILKTTINIGVEKPFGLLHITDVHLTRDDRSGLHRQRVFEGDNEGAIEEYFFQAIKYAKENGLYVLCTGDLIDFFSDENFAFVDKYFSNLDYLYAVGNHDFCHLMGEARDDTEYKWEQIGRIAPHINTNLNFASRVIGGVNFITLDNSYYLITEGQLEMLKAEVARGYPIILAMHVPLYGREQAEAKLGRGSSCTFLCGVPDDILDRYTSKRRRKQQTPDEATLRAVEYIKGEPLIKAVISGHTHHNFEEQIADGLMQYTTHGTFAGYAREITVI